MAFQYLKAKFSIFPRLFAPTIDAIFSSLSLAYRWRLLLLQPINFLSALITSPNWLFNNRYSVIYVPTRSGSQRCLLYQPRRDARKKNDDTKPRPIHIDIHGGGFIGGFAEQGGRWLNYLSDNTGAVIVSCHYRIAPRWAYPAAHNDIDDIIIYLITHASTFNADPSIFTIGGSSVGGSLALSTARHIHQFNQRIPTPSSKIPEPKALLGFYSPTDYRIRAEQKPKPPGFPEKDPLPFITPLYDTYPGPERQVNLENSRLHPILADRGDLPRDMFFVIAGIDILLDEQMKFVERVRGEIEDAGHIDSEEMGQRIEWMVMEKGFHGWLELPSAILEEERMLAFNKSIDFIKAVHRKHGFDIKKL